MLTGAEVDIFKEQKSRDKDQLRVPHCSHNDEKIPMFENWEVSVSEMPQTCVTVASLGTCS
jgi:hypothetical protein